MITHGHTDTRTDGQTDRRTDENEVSSAACSRRKHETQDTKQRKSQQLTHTYVLMFNLRT